MSKGNRNRARRDGEPPKGRFQSPVPAAWPDDDHVFIAAVDMIRRMGAKHFELRWNDDPQPTVFMAVARFEVDGGSYFDAGAGMTPRKAAFRLLEIMGDGGTCAHCHRPTAMVDDLGDNLLDALICYYVYDPELRTFRRGCEGDT